MENEQTEWELTSEEQSDLREGFLRRHGAQRVLMELQRIEGLEMERERAWWEAFTRKHNIPEKYAHHLIADHALGKVWVKKG